MELVLIKLLAIDDFPFFFFFFTLYFFNLCGTSDIYFDINIQSCIYISLIKGFKIQERQEKKKK